MGFPLDRNLNLIFSFKQEMIDFLGNPSMKISYICTAALAKD